MPSPEPRVLAALAAAPALAFALTLVLAGCDAGLPPTVTPPPDAPASSAAPGATPALGDAAAGPAVQIAIASSDLAVGRQRFAFAILDEAGGLVQEADAELTFYRIQGETAEAASSAEAAFYPSTLEPAGLYVVYTDFDAAGTWGAEIRATLPDGQAIAPQRVRFEVLEEASAPAVGEAPPPTDNRTLDDEPDIARLTSDPHPDPELYRLTVDEAAASGRPSVVLFATPAYCQSRICGPVIDEVKQAKADWGERVNFLHIEVYKSFDPLVYADEMETWGLRTEPWVFVLGSDGRVAERLEASVTAAELDLVLERVAATGSEEGPPSP
jgi:hypothetical protein